MRHFGYITLNSKYRGQEISLFLPRGEFEYDESPHPPPGEWVRIERNSESLKRSPKRFHPNSLSTRKCREDLGHQFIRLQDFTSYPTASPYLPHCSFDGMRGEENLISKLTKSLAPLEALGRGGLYRANIHWGPTHKSQILQSKARLKSVSENKRFFLFCCSIK